MYNYMSTPQNIFFNLTRAPKLAHSGSKKPKMTPELGQKQKSKLKEAQKITVFQLYD